MYSFTYKGSTFPRRALLKNSNKCDIHQLLMQESAVMRFLYKSIERLYEYVSLHFASRNKEARQSDGEIMVYVRLLPAQTNRCIIHLYDISIRCCWSICFTAWASKSLRFPSFLISVLFIITCDVLCAWCYTLLNEYIKYTTDIAEIRV